LIVWALAQSRGDGHRSIVTPERTLSEYNKDSIFWQHIIMLWLYFPSSNSISIRVTMLALICFELPGDIPGGPKKWTTTFYFIFYNSSSIYTFLKNTLNCWYWA